MSDLDTLLEVQDLDTRADQLRHRLAHDATLSEVRTREAMLAELDGEIGQLERERDQFRREQRRHEDEVALCDEKIAHVDATLYGGTVTAHKELEALQAELTMLKARKSEIEDHVIEQMELGEPLDNDLGELAATRAALLQRIEEAAAAVTIMQAEVAVGLDEVAARRDALVGDLPQELVAAYGRSRQAAGGQGVARLAAGGRCEGCHLTLPRAEYESLKRAAIDELLHCPECGRILVR